MSWEKCLGMAGGLLVVRPCVTMRATSSREDPWKGGERAHN